jgi:hypothetical protein
MESPAATAVTSFRNSDGSDLCHNFPMVVSFASPAQRVESCLNWKRARFFFLLWLEKLAKGWRLQARCIK